MELRMLNVADDASFARVVIDEIAIFSMSLIIIIAITHL